MKRSRFTEEQIIGTLREQEAELSRPRYLRNILGEALAEASGGIHVPRQLERPMTIKPVQGLRLTGAFDKHGQRENMMRTVLAAGLALVLAACGDAADLQPVKQGALDLGGQALEAASGVVDTKTACMLAGQTEAFCGCVQDSLGTRMTGEHLEALKTLVSESLSGDGLSAAIEKASSVDAPTREALLRCATAAAVEGALAEAGN